MQTSRFQLGLIATLAVGLGFSLASSVAVGYPAGAAVSLGTNPVWSVGGGFSSTAYTEFITAPSDREVVITDFLLSVGHGHSELLFLRLASGEVVGKLLIFGASQPGGGPVSHTMTSGIRVPAGEELQIKTQGGNSIHYTLSGYYAQP
jgi:hypothetical protein